MKRRAPPNPSRIATAVLKPGLGLAFGCVGLVVAISFSCCFLTAVAWKIKEMAPRAWTRAVAIVLVIDTFYPTLEEGDSEEVAAKGLDPEEVALALEASEWISETTGIPGDAALYLAQSQLEGLDADYDAEDAVRSNPNLNGDRQVTDINWLLDRWEQHNVREMGERETAHIYEGYNGYTGHQSAGEMPGGFIPSTFRQICEEALIPSGDPVLMTCDPWNDRVRYHATAWWDYRIGYDPRDSKEERIESLTGWNSRLWWRENMVERAEEIASLGIEYDIRLTAGFGILGDHNADLRQIALVVLDGLNLLPEEIRLARQTALGELPSGTAGSGDVTLDLETEVPVYDGESYNVALWAQKNPVIEISPGQVWSFCHQTDQTGWDEYKFAAGINAGGICANASMIVSMVERSPELTLVEAHPHSPTNWPRFTYAVNCPGADLQVRNNSEHTVTLQWVRDGDTLILTADGGGNEDNETTTGSVP